LISFALAGLLNSVDKLFPPAYAEGYMLSTLRVFLQTFSFKSAILQASLLFFIQTLFSFFQTFLLSFKLPFHSKTAGETPYFRENIAVQTHIISCSL